MRMTSEERRAMIAGWADDNDEPAENAPQQAQQAQGNPEASPKGGKEEKNEEAQRKQGQEEDI